MAVSGCTRECAEAQGKDIGVIATEKGWNLYVCGNGGNEAATWRSVCQRHRRRDADPHGGPLADVLYPHCRPAAANQYRMDNLEGGIDYLREVILEDSLGIGEELEQEMARVVASYQCEWQTTLNDPQRLALFRSYVNSDRPDDAVQRHMLRGQPCRSPYAAKVRCRPSMAGHLRSGGHSRAGRDWRAAGRAPDCAVSFW